MISNVIIDHLCYQISLTVHHAIRALKNSTKLSNPFFRPRFLSKEGYECSKTTHETNNVKWTDTIYYNNDKFVYRQCNCVASYATSSSVFRYHRSTYRSDPSSSRRRHITKASTRYMFRSNSRFRLTNKTNSFQLDYWAFNTVKQLCSFFRFNFTAHTSL